MKRLAAAVLLLCPLLGLGLGHVLAWLFVGKTPKRIIYP